MNIFLGLIMIGIGYVFCLKTEFMLNNFGRIPFFEKFLTTEGGSRLGYKVIGIILIFFGTLIMTGLIGPFLGWALGPLIKTMGPVRNTNV